MIRKLLMGGFLCLFMLVVVNPILAKDLIFPHVVVNETWDAGIALVNTSDNDSAGVVFVHADGFVSVPYRIIIPAHDRYYFLLDQIGVYSIVITGCHDDVYGVFIRLWKGQPIGEVNAIEIYR